MVFFIISLSVLVLFPDVLSALEISVPGPKALVGSVLAGASLLNTSQFLDGDLAFCFPFSVFL